MEVRVGLQYSGHHGNSNMKTDKMCNQVIFRAADPGSFFVFVLHSFRSSRLLSSPPSFTRYPRAGPSRIFFLLLLLQRWQQQQQQRRRLDCDHPNGWRKKTSSSGGSVRIYRLNRQAINKEQWLFCFRLRLLLLFERWRR